MKEETKIPLDDVYEPTKEPEFITIQRDGIYLVNGEEKELKVGDKVPVGTTPIRFPFHFHFKWIAP